LIQIKDLRQGKDSLKLTDSTCRVKAVTETEFVPEKD